MKFLKLIICVFVNSIGTKYQITSDWKVRGGNCSLISVFVNSSDYSGHIKSSRVSIVKGMYFGFFRSKRVKQEFHGAFEKGDISKNECYH